MKGLRTTTVICHLIAVVQITASFLIKHPCPVSHPCICRGTVIDCRNKGLSQIIGEVGFVDVGNFDTVDYGENNLTSIEIAAFAGFTNLETLLLDSNNISTLDDSAFNGVVTSLREVNLANNNLHEIPSALCRLRSLENLNVSGNPITPDSLDMSCDGTPAVHWKDSVLKRQGLTITTFSFGKEGYINTWPTVLSHLQGLQHLQVIGSNIPLTITMSFHGYTQTLKTLSFRYSHLTQVPLALSDLTHLEELHIDYNKYPYSLDNTIQDVGTSLKVLSLNYDSLSTFPSHIKFLPHLQNLSLEGNDLRFVSDESIEILKLTNISYLSLKNCGLKRIPGSLSVVKSLIQLDLSYNKIVTIEYNDFINVENLRNLSLASNPLKYISSTAFFGLHSLKHLDLSSTDITVMPVGVQNLISINVIDLRHTKMECTCDMVWVKLWEEQNERSDLSVNILGECETIHSPIDDYITRRLPTCPDYLRIKDSE